MRVLVIGTACLLLASGALAAGEQVELADGRVLNVKHPLQDGVSEPVPLMSTVSLPDYPQDELGLRAASVVRLAVLVDRRGRAVAVEVLGSTHPGTAFGEVAAEAVGGWRFRSARLGERRVNSYTIIDVGFPQPDDDTLARSEAGLPAEGPLPSAAIVIPGTSIGSLAIPGSSNDALFGETIIGGGMPTLGTFIGPGGRTGAGVALGIAGRRVERPAGRPTIVAAPGGHTNGR